MQAADGPIVKFLACWVVKLEGRIAE